MMPAAKTTTAFSMVIGLLPFASVPSHAELAHVDERHRLDRLVEAGHVSGSGLKAGFFIWEEPTPVPSRRGALLL
jgi:hypothetical protein